MNNEVKLNYNDLNFEKMNSTLANPDFANWYYNHIVNNNEGELTIESFIELINKYNKN